MLHDILLCVKDGEYSINSKRKRKRLSIYFPNDEYYFKSQDQMKVLFADLPESIENITEIVDKIEVFNFKKRCFTSTLIFQMSLLILRMKKMGKKRRKCYLRHITYEGAKNQISKS